MKKYVLTFCIFLLSISASATQIEFNEAESPYITLERAFNIARPIEAEAFPTEEQTYTKTKMLKLVDRLVDSNLSLLEFYKIGIIGLVKRVDRKVIPAVPARGPLFPGSPETVQLKETFFFCKDECKSVADLIGTVGIMKTDPQETSIQWERSRKYIWRIYGKSVIGKSIINNQVVYLYGWIE